MRIAMPSPNSKTPQTKINESRIKAEGQQPNPENSANNIIRKTRSVFLTEHDQIFRTRNIWRNQKANKTQSKRTVKQLQTDFTSIRSWKDLNRVKNRFRTEVLKKKSKQQILLENLQIIDRIEKTPPRVDSWNNYTPPKSPRMLEIQKSREKIFEENMKIIERIEQVPPKVESWNAVKKKVNTNLLLQREKKQEKLFFKNMEIIEKIEATPPRVESWNDLKWLRKNNEAQRLKKSKRLNFDKIKKFIEQAQQKLRNQQFLESTKHKRSKTLPTKTNLRRQADRIESEKRQKRFVAKIQGTKCSIDCWLNNRKPTLMELKSRRQAKQMNLMKPKNFIF